MKDSVSIFSGTKPTPLDSTDWMTVLDNIKSDRYRKAIEKARSISDTADYREYKKKLPAVTFCGEFSENRQKDMVKSATGFIIPDIDHIEDVESVFKLLKRDRHIWFAFRSPSGDGIKCGIRAKNIETDDDIKNLFASVEWYFKDIYGITLDPACKDISRLTFVSHDPDLFINPEPIFFDIEKWAKKETHPVYDPPPQYRDNGWKEMYGAKVLKSSCDKIRASQPGNQHYVRLKMARLVGGFIGEYISEDVALSELERAVSDSGAKNMRSAMKTVSDGIQYGKGTPITVEHDYIPSNNKDIPYYYDDSEVVEEGKQSKQSKQSKHGKQRSAGGKQEVSRGKQGQQDDKENVPQNLAANIKEWITNSAGSFTVDQIDREFCLTTRLEKNRRARALNKYKELELIKSDKKIKGKYHVIDKKIEFIDLTHTDEKPFNIFLPFGLEQHVKIPRKAVIVVAGTSNAGKTALAINVLKLNLTQKYEKMYLMSEMGAGEYKSRIMSFDDISLSDWQQVKAAQKSYDFDGAIQGHNQDGLTCIDFLEEIDGEYFKIASSIRDIYDALGDGVAWINIQKKTGSEYARGGEATKEKARLYMTLDHLCTKEKSIVCALKITKLKEFKSKNLQDSEIHFELTRGAVITPLIPWTPSYKIDRKKCAVEYAADRPIEKLVDFDGYTFLTVEQDMVRITMEQAGRWQASFGDIDVCLELERISKDSYSKPFLKKGSYFFQLAGILEKKNRIS